MIQSTDEAKYVSAPMTITQVIWLGRIMEGTDEKQKDATRLYYDNKSTITMAKNLFHQTSFYLRNH